MCYGAGHCFMVAEAAGNKSWQAFLLLWQLHSAGYRSNPHIPHAKLVRMQILRFKGPGFSYLNFLSSMHCLMHFPFRDSHVQTFIQYMNPMWVHTTLNAVMEQSLSWAERLLVSFLEFHSPTDLLSEENTSCSRLIWIPEKNSEKLNSQTPFVFSSHTLLMWLLVSGWYYQTHLWKLGTLAFYECSCNGSMSLFFYLSTLKIALPPQVECRKL